MVNVGLSVSPGVVLRPNDNDALWGNPDSNCCVNADCCMLRVDYEGSGSTVDQQVFKFRCGEVPIQRHIAGPRDCVAEK